VGVSVLDTLLVAVSDGLCMHRRRARSRMQGWGSFLYRPGIAEPPACPMWRCPNIKAPLAILHKQGQAGPRCSAGLRF